MNRKAFFSLVKVFTVIFSILYTFTPFATAVLAFDPGTPTPCNIQITRGTVICFASIKDAVDAAQAGETITVNAGTYTLDSTVNFDTPNLTLEGIGNPIIQVSGTGYRIDISASGNTVKGFNIVKTDKTGEQNIIWIHANNTSILNNEFSGQYVFGDSEVSRAIVISGGFSGLFIQNNIFHDLRQPAYISGVTTGTISNNYTYKTRGWVVEQGNMTFTNNTWGTGLNSNIYDIAILSATSSAYYTDIAQMSLDNSHAFIEDQRTSPATLSIVYVDGSVATSGDGTARSPKKTINEGITRVIANGGIVYIAAGTYEEQVSIDSKNITLIGAGSSNTYVTSPSTLQTLFTTSGANKPILYVHKANVNISGITVDGLGRANGNYRMVGIAYYNASGSVKNSNIVNIKETPASGNQQGNALYIYSDDNTSRTINVDSISIHDYQKNGAVFAGNNLTVNISNSTVKGLGQIAFIAQNGIQYSNGATGAIDGNVITDNYYTPANWSATGILLYGAGANLKITNNELSNNGWGALYVYGAGDGLQIIDNNIHNNLGEGIDLSGSGLTNAKILGNTLKDNYTGLWVDSDVPSGLLVYDNTFSNTTNVEDSTSINYDNGSSRGNFWNNYTGVDLNGDGIGETTYTIDSDSQDRYPQTTNLLSVKVNSVTTSKGIYKTGDVLAFDVNVTNTGTLPFTTTNENLVANITDPSGTYISGTFRQSVPLNLVAGETKTITFYTNSQIIPSTWTEGTYRIHVSVYSDRAAIGYLAGGQYSSTTFKIDNTSPVTPTNLTFKQTNGTVLGCDTYTNQYTLTTAWNSSSSSDVAYYEYRSYNPTTGWVYGPVNVGLTTSRTGSFTVGNGTYGFAVRAVDFAGNTSDWTSSDIASSCKITYDNVAPTTPTNGTPNGKTIPTNNFDFNWDKSTDNSPLTYEFQSSMNPAEVNGVLTTGIWSSGTLPTNMIHSAGAPDGTWYWQVRAKDAAGNYSSWSEIWTVKLDTVAPSTPILVSPDNGVFTKGASITNVWSDTSADVAYYNYESYNDANLQSLRWNGTFTTTSNTATNVADATFWWRVQAVDYAGNKSAWSNAWKITVDNTTPETAFTLNQSNTVHNSPIIIRGTSTDVNGVHNVSLYYRVSGSSDWNLMTTLHNENEVIYNWSYSWTPSIEGTFDVKAEGTDLAGNTEHSPMMQNIIYDKTLPTIGNVTLTIDYLGKYINGAAGFLITAPVSDSLSGVNTSSCMYTLDGSTWLNGYYLNNKCTFGVSSNQLFDNQGLEISARVTDNAGNTVTSNIVERKVDKELAQSQVVIDNTYYGPNSLPLIKGTASDTVSSITSVKVTLKRNSDNKYWTLGNIWTTLPMMHNVSGNNNWTLTQSLPNMQNGLTYTVTPYAWDQVHVLPGTGVTDSFIWDSQLPTDPSGFTSSPTINTPSNDNTVTVSFNDGTDALSGVKGYYYSFSQQEETPSLTNWLPVGTTSVTSTTLSDGTWYFNIRTVDNVGNITSTSHYGPFVIDTTAPDVQITAPTSTYLSGAVAVRGSVTDVNPDHYWFVITDSNGTQVAGLGTVTDKTSFADKLLLNWDTTTIPDGKYTIKLEARDSANNKDNGSVQWLVVNVDNTKPTIDLQFDAPGVSNKGFKAVFSEDVSQADAENPANYFLNNWPTAGGSGDLSGDATIVYESATHTATVTFSNANWYISPEQQWGVENIHDLAGNILAVTPYTEYSTPMVAPVTSISGTDSQWHNTDVLVTLTCTDVDGSGCYKTHYSLNGGTYQEGNILTISNEGNNSITYYSEDNAGNVENVQTSEIVKIDKTNPDLAILNPSTTLPIAGAFTINGTTSDTLSGVKKITLDFGNGTTQDAILGASTWSLDVNNGLFNLADGTYNVTVTSKDNSGNTTVAILNNLVIDNTKPLAQVLGTITFTTGATTLRLLSLSDNNALDQVCYTIDGGTLTCTSVTGTAYSWDVTSLINTLNVGSHTFTYYVVDKAGNQSDSNTLLADNDPYATNITVNAVAQQGQVQGVSTTSSTTTDEQTTSPSTEEVKGAEDTSSVNTTNTNAQNNTLPWWAYAAGGTLLLSLIFFIAWKRRKERR